MPSSSNIGAGWTPIQGANYTVTFNAVTNQYHTTFERINSPKTLKKDLKAKTDDSELFSKTKLREPTVPKEGDIAVATNPYIQELFRDVPF